MKAKYIVEAANHPTDPEADEVQCLINFQHNLISSVGVSKSNVM